VVSHQRLRQVLLLRAKPGHTTGSWEEGKEGRGRNLSTPQAQWISGGVGGEVWGGEVCRGESVGGRGVRGERCGGERCRGEVCGGRGVGRGVGGERCGGEKVSGGGCEGGEV